MSRENLIELFFNGSESDSVSLEFEDFRVCFDLFEEVSNFYFMDFLISRYDLKRRILHCRPFSVRLTSDAVYCTDRLDDFGLCLEVINDILYIGARDYLFK